MALLTNINGKFSVSDAGAVTFNNAFTFPTADGTANYVLKTNGSGQLSWSPDNNNGDITGSGTANTVTKFTGAKTIGDGPITFSSNDSTFAGNVGVGFAAQSNIRTFVYDNSANYSLAVQQDGSGIPFQVTSGGSVRMIVANSGDVGIGTASPNANLEVSAATDTTISIASSDTSINVGQNIGILEFASNNETSLSQVYTPFSKIKTISESAVSGTGSVNGAITFETADTNVISERMRIDSSGNVGINDTSPNTANLSIKGQSTGVSANYPMLKLLGQNTSSDGLHITTTGTGNNYYAIKVATGANSSAFNVTNAGNVGIGTTSPSQKLSIVTNAVTSNPEYIEFTDAGSGSSWVSGQDYGGMQWFMGDGTGIGAHTVAQIKAQNEHTGAAGNAAIVFSTAPYNTVMSERMRITSGGNVGIGTDNPQSKLHVKSSESGASAPWTNADNLIIEDSGNAGLAFQTPNTGAATIAFQDPESVQAGFIQYLHADNALRFATNGNNERMRIDSSGNVGIGMTSPNFKLGLSNSNTLTAVYQQFTNGTTGTTSSDGTVMGIDSDGDFLINNQEAKEIKLYTSDTQRLTIQSGGNVGIGDTNPAYRLSVKKVNIATPAIMVSGAFYGGPRIQTYGLDADANAWMGLGTDMSGAPYEHNIYFSDTGTFGRLSMGTYNGTTYSEKMCVLRTGSVGIGVTSPTGKFNSYISATRQLTHNGNGGDLSIISDNNSSPVMFIKGTGSADLLNVFDNTTEVFTILDGGNVGIGDTTPSYKLDVNGTIRATGDVIAYSDERVKENIKTIDNSLEKVSKLRGVEFNKIGDDVKSIGVIAQEIEKVVPEVVKEDDKGMKSVAYGNISGLLIEAIKELKTEIEELKKYKCDCKK